MLLLTYWLHMCIVHCALSDEQIPVLILINSYILFGACMHNVSDSADGMENTVACRVGVDSKM